MVPLREPPRPADDGGGPRSASSAAPVQPRSARLHGLLRARRARLRARLPLCARLSIRRSSRSCRASASQGGLRRRPRLPTGDPLVSCGRRSVDRLRSISRKPDHDHRRFRCRRGAPEDPGRRLLPRSWHVLHRAARPPARQSPSADASHSRALAAGSDRHRPPSGLRRSIHVHRPAFRARVRLLVADRRVHRTAARAARRPLACATRASQRGRSRARAPANTARRDAGCSGPRPRRPNARALFLVARRAHVRRLRGNPRTPSG